MNILFIGNSHTYYHDMPRKVALLGLRDGVDCHTVMIAHGGWRLSQHVKEADVKFNVKYGMYDFIIIQDHSYPIEFIEEFKEGVSTLATMARNVGSIPLLYETWTRVDDEKNQIKIHKLHEEVAEKNKIRLICILHCLTAGFAEQIGRVAPAVGRDAEHSGRLGFLPAEAGFHL